MLQKTILIRGAGEIASGIAHRLWRAGFQRIVMTEIESPVAVRRRVSFSEAVFDGNACVENVQATLANVPHDIHKIWSKRRIALLVDPDCLFISEIRPQVIVDAILAKKNLGTTMALADFVIGLGPGFFAGNDCHCLIETNRGHNLGRLITHGPTSGNTGVPGSIMGQTHNRVLRAQSEGVLETWRHIGDFVEIHSPVALVSGKPVYAQISGFLRGILRSGSYVRTFLKIADIDPRMERDNCFTISDKARSLGGSVLEAILAQSHGTLFNRS